ncbi:MAG: polyphosphate kinase 2 family protein [Chloroflexota bacterium]|nr:MAG: polyphosphate kinase 2 family protein [Chloroflexota bacterium]
MHGSPQRLGDAFRVAPGTSVRLATMDPGATLGFDKDAARDRTAADLDRLEVLQETVWAEHRHRILIVLQGIDTAGKDGAIRHLMRAFNAMGVRAVPFGVPVGPELAHDFLWRVHAQVPGDGEIVIFNRSHYEGVLAERIGELVPEATWARRYDAINAFERLLAVEGTTIIKLFLHISPAEQLERLRARLADPAKRWKFRRSDLRDRERWDVAIAAFDDALTRCSTAEAPWYVIPSDHKWFRNLAVGTIVADAIEALQPAFPEPEGLPADLPLS